MVWSGLLHGTTGSGEPWHACVICYEPCTRDKLEPVSADPDKVWDVCKGCAEIEKARGAVY